MPADEERRLQALRELHVLDTAAEERFDRLVRLAQQLFDVPIALVSLVDAERQWFKARVGVAESGTARDISFCGYAILGREIFEIPDATLDARFAANPLVNGERHALRFYAGAPLLSDDGSCVGVFCIKDVRPRRLSAAQRQALRDLADCAQGELLASRRQVTAAAALALPAFEDRDRHSGFAASLERQLADLERVAHIGCWQLDLRSGRLNCSDQVLRMCGLEPGRVAPTWAAFLELVHPEDRSSVEAASLRCQHTGQSDCSIVHRIVRRSDAQVRYLEQRCQHQRDAGGSLVGLIGTAQDVTERELATQALSRAASVFEHSNDAIVITDAEGTILDVNAALCRNTGRSRAELLGQNPRIWASGRHDKDFYRQMWQALHQQGLWRGEIWNRRKCGQIYPSLLTISPVRDASGRLQGYAGISTDLSALREQQHQVERLSQYDALTGLPNRHLLADRINQAMAQARQQQRQVAVVYCDLDGFKAINDQFGDEVGDRILIALAHSLQQVLRPGDTLSRLGGDEFVAVLCGLPDSDACTPVLHALLAAVALPLDPLHQYTARLSVSLGVSFYPQTDPVDADQLLRQADQAMCKAKQSGKNRYHCFDAEADAEVRSRHAEIESIAHGLRQREFVLVYQPKVNLRTGAVIGLEALVRWQHPQRGLLVPGAFLPALEQQPLVVTLGDWVIDAALAQMQAWQRLGLQLPLSVNVDALQLAQPDFIDKLRAALLRYPGLPREALTLEVLETSALGDLAAVTDLLYQCQELGVPTALDDFGTGFSSLTYLKHLPTQELKIDQSFIRGLLDDPVDVAILQGIFSLAQALGRRVVAEGIETEAHGSLLLRLGCAYGQGNIIAEPMTAERVPDWLAQWRPPPAWAATAATSACPLP